jgi:hypothetical protein
MGAQSILYTPLIVALTGTLQLSHLHIGNNLNILLHYASGTGASGAKDARNAISAAAAYSITPPHLSHRLVIGSSLPLHFAVRWYPSNSLPLAEQWRGMGGHVYTSTIVYCLLSMGAGVALSWAYFKGFVLPKRLKGYIARQGGKFGNGSGLPMTGYGYNGSTAAATATGGYGYGYSGGGYGYAKKD